MVTYISKLTMNSGDSTFKHGDINLWNICVCAFIFISIFIHLVLVLYMCLFMYSLHLKRKHCHVSHGKPIHEVDQP